MPIGALHDELEEQRERFQLDKKQAQKVAKITNAFAKKRTYDYLIGIDPGANNGIAIYSPDQKKIIWGKTLDFWSLITFLDKWIAEHKQKAPFKFYVENPNLNAPTFKKKGVAAHERPKMDRISQNVGSNKRDAQLIIEYLERKGVECQPIRPGKFTLSKLSQKQFELTTKCTLELSQHARDAAMLVWNK